MYPEFMTGLVDLTLPVSPTLRGVSREPAFQLEKDGWNGTLWHLYSHAGTHMDAPVHFGVSEVGIDEKPLAECFTTAWKVDLRPIASSTLITVESLGSVVDFLQSGESLLLQTGWSEYVNNPEKYRDGLPRISVDLAEWCVERGVAILGVEPPSVADVNNLDEVTRIHRILLSGGVTIVEGLTNLDQIAGTRCGFAAVPLPLKGCDGSPVRAMAWNIERDDSSEKGHEA